MHDKTGLNTFLHLSGRLCVKHPTLMEETYVPILDNNDLSKVRCNHEHYGWDGSIDVKQVEIEPGVHGIDPVLTEDQPRLDPWAQLNEIEERLAPLEDMVADHLAKLIFEVSRRDESTISATGANNIAAAIRQQFEVSLLEAEEAQDDDRGDFGMPVLGSSFRCKSVPLDLNGVVINQQGLRFKRDGKVGRVQDIFGDAMDLYTRKAAGYGDGKQDTADFLGVKGQFADMNRKFWKLYYMLWEESIPAFPDEGGGEDAIEVLQDFMGHCALTIDFLRQQDNNKEEGTK